jgi:hypothetical protein
MQAYDEDALAGVEDAFAASHAAFRALSATMASADACSWTCDQLEEHLEVRGREVLRRLLQDHLELRALRERHAVALGQAIPPTDAQGAVHRAVEVGHTRALATIFGTVVVERCAFRAAGTANLYPADAVLNLPERLHSYGLAKRAVLEAVRGSFQAAHAAVVACCGNVAGKRQVQQLTVAAAGEIDAFYQAAVPMPSTDDTLLVLSVDGKGVVMRPEALRDQTRRAAAAKGGNTYRTRLASGEKQGRKRMATLGVVYDADPVPRAPQEVISLAGTDTDHHDGGGGRRGRKGPVAVSKWLTGSVAAGCEEVIAAVFDQATQRDPIHRRTWVVLVDGARHQLEVIQAEAARRNVTVHPEAALHGQQRRLRPRLALPLATATSARPPGPLPDPAHPSSLISGSLQQSCTQPHSPRRWHARAAARRDPHATAVQPCRGRVDQPAGAQLPGRVPARGPLQAPGRGAALRQRAL